MEFYLNGEKRNYEGDPNLNLMDYLRNAEKIISPKDGCSPEGVCGCCTVLLDNKAVKSCISAMKRVEGKEVVTTEGLSAEKRETVVNAFMEKGGLQCGFCTPGILMKVWPLFEKPEQPSREDFVKALNSNLCRCTGFKKIVDSCVHAAEAIQQGKTLSLPAYTGKLGDSLPKYDSRRLATGHAPYVADVELEGMLYGALKFSDHPRAKVLSMDLSEAGAHPGVERIFTAEDIPGARHTGLIVQDWPLMIEIGEETRYIGDVLAVVVADTEKNAREAVQKINVDYEVLTPVTDPKAALESSSPQVHAKGNCFRMRKSIVVMSKPHAKKVLTSARGPTPPSGSNTRSWKWNVVLRHLQRMASKSIPRVRVFMRIARASVASWDFPRKWFV